MIVIENIPVIDSNQLQNYIKNSMDSKKLKVFPQTFLDTKYDFVVWYDNKFSVNVKDTLRVIKKWNNNHALMLHRHPRLLNVIQEYNEAMWHPRYNAQSNSYINYMRSSEQNGFTTEYKIHSQTGFIIYNLNHNLTELIQEKWMEEIKKCGIECQISFNLFRQQYEDLIGEFIYPIEFPS